VDVPNTVSSKLSCVFNLQLCLGFQFRFLARRATESLLWVKLGRSFQTGSAMTDSKANEQFDAASGDAPSTASDKKEREKQ
jgi:hypothetical protein